MLTYVCRCIHPPTHTYTTPPPPPQIIPPGPLERSWPLPRSSPHHSLFPSFSSPTFTIHIYRPLTLSQDPPWSTHCRIAAQAVPVLPTMPLPSQMTPSVRHFADQSSLARAACPMAFPKPCPLITLSLVALARYVLPTAPSIISTSSPSYCYPVPTSIRPLLDYTH